MRPASYCAACYKRHRINPDLCSDRSTHVRLGDIRTPLTFGRTATSGGWTVYAFDNTTEDTGNYGGGPVQVTGTDSYGVYFDVGVTTGAQEVGIIIHNPTAPGGDQKDTPNNLFVDPAAQGFEYWAYAGIACLYTSAPSLSNPTAILPGYVRVHYHRTDGNYSGWTIYAFYDTTEYTGDYNSGLVPVTNSDDYGVYFDVAVIPNAQNLGLIIHNPSAPGGDQKDPGLKTSLIESFHGRGSRHWGHEIRQVVARVSRA